MARGRVLKHDGTTTVMVVGEAHRQWVVKRYNTKNRWHAVRRALRTSRAMNCWSAAWQLEAAGIDTPRPVAVLEERRLRRLKGRSYFVCEFIAGETLDRALSRRDGHRAYLVERAASIVRRLRRHRIAHGDLKATNFVVRDDRLYLVDLDAMKQGPGPAVDAALSKDQQRFMRNWADDPTLSREFEALLAD